jgi:hypothetical protein
MTRQALERVIAFYDAAGRPVDAEQYRLRRAN